MPGSRPALSRPLRAMIGAGVVSALLLAPSCGSLIATQHSVEALEQQRGFSWERRETPGFTIFLEHRTEASERFDAIASDAARARGEVLRYLELEQYGPTVSLFVVESRERMGQLIGRETLGTGYYTSNAVCVVWGDSALSRITHELFHVVAMNAWGVPERWINEGAAVDADTQLRGIDLFALCARLRERGALPDLREITTGFNAIPSARSYPAAGSLVRFLRETYGIDAVHALWTDGRDALGAVTGSDATALETAWLDRIDRAGAPHPENDPGARLDHDAP